MPFPSLTEPVSPDVLPRQFSIALGSEELVALTEWGGRYAPSVLGAYTLDCCFLPDGRRRWVADEANILGWLDFTDANQPAVGSVAVPYSLIRDSLISDVLDEGVSLSFDLDAGTLSTCRGSIAMSMGLPPLPETTFPPTPDPECVAFVSARDVSVAASHLQSIPLPIGGEEGPPFPLPYLTITIADGKARLRRDWREYGHAPVEIEIEAWGVVDFDASFYADFALRELEAANEMAGGVVTIGLFDEAPALLQVSAGNWGMIVTLGTDLVLRHRADIEMVLGAADIEYESDPYVGRNPVVVASVQDRKVEATLVRGPQLRQSHVRVSTVVAGGVSWNPELATEMNLWNDKWFDTKLMVVNGDLVIVRDVSVADLGQLPPAMFDLVEKSLIVSDVIGVFM